MRSDRINGNHDNLKGDDRKRCKGLNYTKRVQTHNAEFSGKKSQQQWRNTRLGSPCRSREVPVKAEAQHIPVPHATAQHLKILFNSLMFLFASGDKMNRFNVIYQFEDAREFLSKQTSFSDLFAYLPLSLLLGLSTLTFLRFNSFLTYFTKTLIKNSTTKTA